MRQQLRSLYLAHILTMTLGGVCLGVAMATTVASCAIPASIAGRSTAQLTAPGVQALHIVEVVKTLDIIRDAAIYAEVAKVTPTTTARIIVTAHKSIIEVVREATGGWKATVLEILTQLKQHIPEADRAHFVPYIDAAISVIKAVIQ